MSESDVLNAWQAIESGKIQEGVEKLNLIYEGRAAREVAIAGAYLWCHKISAALEFIESETQDWNRYRFDDAWRFRAVCYSMLQEPNRALSCLENQWKCQYAQGGITQRPLLFFYLGSYFPHVVSTETLRQVVSKAQRAGGRSEYSKFLLGAYDFLLGNKATLSLPDNRHLAIPPLQLESMAWDLRWIMSIRLRALGQLAEIPSFVAEMKPGFASRRHTAECHAARYDYHQYVQSLW